MMKLQIAPSSFSQKKKKQKSGGGQQQEQNPNVAESTRIRISQIIDQFLSTNDDMYAFEPNLTNAERAVVHELCRKLGLKSRSKGNGNKRHVCVHKIKKNGFTKDGKENCSSFTFSEDAKEVLQDLFTQYPPDDRDLGEETVGKHGGKTEKIREKRDDIFCKPSMNKAEIGRKVESFASKLEKSQELRQITEGRAKLPIASFRDVIMSTIESNQVVLISGETGCGKTTQVPQFLLDYMWGKGEVCKIVCTQPRRISATSVAERISRERGENVGDSVGYKIRLETKGGKNSSIVFCTNGVLLRVLVSKGTERLNAESSKRLAKDAVSDLTHIIVDEIHERDRYSDFMLAILRDMLPSYPQLRLVLMSATLDAERFSQYFGGSPIIRVPGFTYPVKTFFLEDVLTILKATENNHLDCASEDAMVDEFEFELGEEYKIALDEAINLAWLNDEFDTLRDLVSSERTPKVFNYQHSSSGVTPLMVFAKKGKVGDVCMLLSFGADCHLQDSDGITAPEWAERESQGEASEIIKKHMEKVHSNCEEDQELLDKYLSTSNPELVDIALIEKLLRKICMDSKDGAILVFLPGWDDINKMREKLLASPFFKDCSKFLIISLHSMVPSAEQRKVFRRPPLGCRKIVLSTNIAETAITIDDVVYVIDSGRMKEKSYDPYNNVSTLQSSWVSKASAKQREGRAGRCQPGICYHIYSKLRAASMPDFQIPEIKRMPIEELCLQAKLIDPNCNIENFLRKTLDPPVFETIRNAIIVLQDIGALSHEGEQLTDLGEKLGSLPVHPLICKMLFFGILLNCLNPALTLACASDYRDPFILPMLPNDKKKAAAAKSHLASMFGGNSDQLAVVAAFECWMNARKKGQEARFCSQYFVSSSTMNMLFGMRKQLQNELLRHGFIPQDVSNCSLNERNPGILHAVLVSGLYPMVARLLPPFKNTNRSMVETASGEKVRLHPHSSNFKLSFTKSSDQPLIIFDEITRGDGGMHIRNCSVVAPLPLLLLATEMVVVPIKDIDDDDDDNNNESDYEDADEDESGDDKIEMHNKLGEDYEEKVMSSPDNAVKVVVDRWLSFKSIALDVAQIYCLRERLSAAILLKVTHPRKVLSPLLEASMNAIACVLSYDGMSKISSPTEPVDSLTSMVNATEIDQSTHGKVKGMVQNSNGFLRSMPQAYSGTMSWNGPLSSHVQYPIASTHIKPYPRFASQGPSGAISGALRGDSSKRQRGNWS